jgi:hypothetical protein
MLTPEEALLMQAAYAERDRQAQQNTAGLLCAGGGAMLGLGAGAVVHPIGKAIGAMRKTNHVGKPGARLAGGLLGTILGGGLGAGVSAVMQETSPSAKILGKLQSGQELNPNDKMIMARELADLYNNPSQMG